MTESIIKFLDDITLTEWTNWHWEDITKMESEKRQYLRGIQRGPHDANEARKEFTEYLRHRSDGLARRGV